MELFEKLFEKVLPRLVLLWGGYDQWAPQNYRSLVQNIVSFIGLFGKKHV